MNPQTQQNTPQISSFSSSAQSWYGCVCAVILGTKRNPAAATTVSRP